MRKAFWLAVAVVTLAVPGTALAHTVMMTPPPRDPGTAYKTAPCGSVARTNYCTAYDAGATIPVKWKETVGHRGCFQIAVSKANDQSFTILKQVNDPENGTGTVYPDTVKLPDNYTCKDCTLVVRQLMIGVACIGGDAGTGDSLTPPFQNDLDASTYYSCADIRIGDPTPCESPDGGDDASAPEDGGGATPTDDGGSSSSGSNGATTTPSIEQPSGNRQDTSADSGCSTTGGATSGIGLAAAIGVLGISALRRRRSEEG